MHPQSSTFSYFKAAQRSQEAHGKPIAFAGHKASTQRDNRRLHNGALSR